MPRNIVICSDGTGNSANKGRGTNVFHLYEMLDRNGGADTEQIAFYDDGVGTQSLRFIRAFSGALGWGLARNVRQLYRSLCRHPLSANRPSFSRNSFMSSKRRSVRQSEIGSMRWNP